MGEAEIEIVDDGFDDAPDEAPDRSGRILVAIVAVVALALLASLVVLLNGDDRAARDLGADRPVITGATTGTTESTTETPTTADTSTVPPTTETPTTETPTTVVPTTEPPTTTPSSLPAGWVLYSSPDGHFTAPLPAEPAVSHDTAVGQGGVTRTEYTVGGPARTTITVDVTPVGGDAERDPFLTSVIERARVQLASKSSISEPPFDVPGGRAQDAVFTIAGGQFRLRAEYVGATLHVISIAVPQRVIDDAGVTTALRVVTDGYRAAT